jgi:cysteine sulfinate desulfinase/cysteine desulfurase-like protein
MALFIIFFPHVFQSLVAFKAALQLHADALEKHNAAIRLLDERTTTVWKAYIDKMRYIQ